MRLHGFSGTEVLPFLDAVWQESLFGALIPTGRQRAHIQSGGKTQRWRDELSPAANELIMVRFGEQMRRFGYV